MPGRRSRPGTSLTRRSWGRRLAYGALVLVVVIAGCVVWVDRQHRYDIDTSEVRFTHKGHEIVGTLASPRLSGPHGLVVFIHGDGPANADYDGGYPAIWESFARAGYASLSWDQPGVGRSGGNWLSYSMDDRADLALAALDAVVGRQDIDGSRVGLWGASQAGWVLPKIANRRPGLRFIIAVSPAVNWLHQGRFNLLAELDDEGATDGAIAAALSHSDEVRALLQRGAPYDAYLALSQEAARSSGRRDRPMSEGHWRFVSTNFRSDARADLAALTDVPVLLQIAGKDRNVDVADTEAVYREFLGDQVQVRRYLEADHSMLRAEFRDEGLRYWATALFSPRKLFAPGYLADGRAFLRSLPRSPE